MPPFDITAAQIVGLFMESVFYGKLLFNVPHRMTILPYFLRSLPRHVLFNHASSSLEGWGRKTVQNHQQAHGRRSAFYAVVWDDGRWVWTAP